MKINIPARIVELVPDLKATTEGVVERIHRYIGTPVFAKAGTRGSHFRRCWTAYLATNPSPEDLRSLVKIGHFHQIPKKGSKLTGAMLEYRANFVQEVVRRGEPAVESFQRARGDDDNVCRSIPTCIWTHLCV